MPQSIRVLVIDDDPLFRTLIVTHLRKSYILSVASEGSEGYQKALQINPDIAIIDVNMAGWDGLQTLTAFRNDPKLKDVKIVMLTGDSTKQTVMNAIHSGADGYLLKSDFTKELLEKKIASLSKLDLTTAARMANPAAMQNAPHSAGQQKSANAVSSAITAENMPDVKEVQDLLDDWD